MCDLDQPVCQGAFTVINVCNDAKIPDFVHLLCLKYMRHKDIDLVQFKKFMHGVSIPSQSLHGKEIQAL
jgi:hypothetical protein